MTSEEARERQKQSAIVKASTISPKEKIFIDTIIKTKNATKSALEAYDTTDENVAGSIGSENLQKPKIRAEIMRLLGDNDVKIEEIFSVHKRNMLQDKHLPTSQKAVGDFYDILGMKNQEAPSSSNKIAFFIVEKEE
jgi:hypothetical protein